LLSALDLFSSKGYDAVSVREICEAAGITKPTLYHFYGSKEGVFRALLDGALEDFHRAVVEPLAGAPSATDGLRRMARGYFATAVARRDLMRFCLRLVHNPPDTAPATDFPRFYRDIVARVAAAVEKGVRNGEFGPGDTAVRMLVLMGALGEAFCGYLLVGEPLLTPELADSVVETILGGWGAP
jgi:AcrR family transcriptional regulator